MTMTSVTEIPFSCRASPVGRRSPQRRLFLATDWAAPVTPVSAVRPPQDKNNACKFSQRDQAVERHEAPGYLVDESVLAGSFSVAPSLHWWLGSILAHLMQSPNLQCRQSSSRPAPSNFLRTSVAIVLLSDVFGRIDTHPPPLPFPHSVRVKDWPRLASVTAKLAEARPDVHHVCRQDPQLTIPVIRLFVTTSSSKLSTSGPPRAKAVDGSGVSRPHGQPPTSPALSTASTADGDDDQDLESDPPAPELPAPKLPGRVSALLRSPTGPNDDLFETASWGSPYPPHDRNVRRQSFSSDLSEESPIHHLDIDTPFLRPAPDFSQPPDTEPREPLSAAAAVLANRVRRSNRGLTEDWIRAHTAAGEGNIEPRLWFSDGSDSEHSSLSGSELAWLGELTPRAVKAAKAAKKQPRHRRASASIETLKPSEGKDIKLGNSTSMTSEPELRLEPALMAPPQRDEPVDQSAEEGHPTTSQQNTEATSRPLEPSEAAAEPGQPVIETAALAPIPSTPKRLKEKSLPKEPPMTPRIKKKVPWKGKNIMILVPRDDDRGQPGKAPMPLSPGETKRMFASWEELGYSVDGFDLIVEDYQPPGTADAQSRDCWPSAEDLTQERSTGHYRVTLPDLNAWKDYVQELQEAKLRALGVSDATEEPPAPSISPSLTIPSRQASAQYPPLPFSPPIPTSSASSNPGYNYHSQLLSGTTTTTQSPSIASPVPFGQVQGKFNPRQSISLPTGSSPFQMSHAQPWQNQAGILQGLARMDSPLLSLNGIVSPQSPYDLDGFPMSGSPAFNVHQRHQSLQYFPQQMARASPSLQQVREDEEEEAEDYAKSPSKTPEPNKPQQVPIQAEMQDAQYHLEEQLRNQLEHEDYNPQARNNSTKHHENLESAHNRQASGNLAVSEHFANDQVKPVVLHHPRPHSRGQSITQNFFRDHDAPADESNFGRLNGIPESNKPEADEAYEIETNPSNLGTPVQNFEFPASLHQHQKTMSSVSNPWNNATSESTEVHEHERKTSTSKLNVKAPEFKFNPTSNFTPGLFNFSSAPTFQPGAASFQPAVFQAGMAEHVEPSLPPAQFGSSSFGMDAGSPSFNPGQSEFSFSTSGPKFRPDAPSFTPFQSLANSLNKPAKAHKGRTDSIFGDINIDTSEVVRPNRKSKAIPIIRPSSRSSAKSPLMGVAEESAEDEMDSDGRPVQDESRAKRAKSQAPENEDVASFAQMPLASISESNNGNALFIDTSMSSPGTGDVVETKQTTAVPSETSPAAKNDEWQPLQTVKDAVINSHKTQHSAELKSKKQAHKRNSLSATALPFSPGAMSYGEESPATLTRAQPSPVKLAQSGSISDLKKISPKVSDESQFSSPLPPARPKGLKASRFAQAEPEPAPAHAPAPESQPEETIAENTSADVIPSIEPQNTLVELDEEPVKTDAKVEPTFEEIDAVMQQMEIDPSMGVKKKPLEKSMWNQPTPVASRQPSYTLRPAAHEFVPQFNQPVPPYLKDSELEDPFIDPPNTWANGQQHAAMPASDWEGAFSEDEHSKLESRTQFFDGRVNEIVGSLLASRLEPMEKTLLAIQSVLGNKSHRAPSSRRDIRSTTGENQESDADDEDDEVVFNRSASPRRDRRMDQIRIAITEALAAQHQNVAALPEASSADHPSILAALEEMKQHMSAVKSMPHLVRGIEDAQNDDIRPSTSKSDDAILVKLDQLQTKNIDLEQRLQFEQHRVEKEIQERREAEDAAAELTRKLNAAETRVEVEIINKSVYDQRVGDLEERLRLQEEKTEEELKQRRLLEDKLCDAQRQLKHASEEETRVTETLEDRDRRIKELEQLAGKKAMRMTLLEAASNNASQSQSEMTNKLNALECDLKEVRQDNTHWRTEAERADETARRNAGELAVTRDENKVLQTTLQTLTAQLQENERLRESWRGKFMSLQEDMANAAREVAEESARRIKKDQAMLARQEVLDARLQAEAKTRERFEVEMERLQTNERTGMRALNECTRLEGILGELRTEKDILQQTASRYQREFEEARESGASEVKRTRMALQTEIDAANHQVNVVRQDLEDQNAKLRAEIDSIRLEADTTKERNEMLMEGEQTSRAKALEELELKHQNEIEDMQTRYERQINNANEDAGRNEEALLGRLSLSSSKVEHLQDRILHLEEKLEISKQAAAQAVQAAQVAKSTGVEPGSAAASIVAPVPTARATVSSELPEKISPQALRESIMVLQEQLQAREQRIEELEQDIAKLDPEAPSKISKRDDEISWLRELLAVRHSDLQDIINALAFDSFDRERVKDAAIRLKANLQMEEQERERAMNGGSAITLPNIAQSIQAATPRVAQTIGSGFNAFDRWRKSSQPSFLSGVLNSPSVSHAGTPSRSKGPSAQQSKLLSGLLTPPASGLRQPPTADNKPQPTAFASTGRRFPSHGIAPNRLRGESESSAPADDEGTRIPEDTTPPRRLEQPADPVTPPMMRQSGYDSDAQPGDFDGHDFFED
ncbi:hypothetical protein LLEC1_00187 [Akanthomyces lecanii]|uniref:Myosin class II heavy chain n=1 Tax=Cordyceps confragosa TaxID=2714763 RepID=A0A179IM83_CORDF|nr:hypothetical protein LLEC1_00187 [Akanthomyces lecanii]